MRAALLGSILLLAGSCAPSCPCGQSYDRDPFDPTGDSLALGRGHALGDHCFCACGEGAELQRLPPSRTCEAFERLACADGEHWICE